MKSAAMLVVDLPEDVPSLTTNKIRYTVNEAIVANCTSPNSFPGANITWYINGMQVLATNSWTIYNNDRGEILETTSSELIIKRPVFFEGRLMLKCRATIFTLYIKVADVTLFIEEPQDASPRPPASIRHHDAFGKGTGVKLHSSYFIPTLIIVFMKLIMR